MDTQKLYFLLRTAVLSATLTCSVAGMAIAAERATPAASPKSSDQLCPPFGWSEGLKAFLAPNASIPTTEPNSDCAFHEWSWEAFTWATAVDANGVPRFLTLPTPDDLVSTPPKLKKGEVRILRLGARSLKHHKNADNPEVAGAMVEADGNMLVAPNGYPVLASVHMNPSYFASAKNNLMVNHGYENNPNQDDYFHVGAAVVKATWLRLDKGESAPAGSYTTIAEVPVLTIDNTKHQVVPTGKFVTATVALVGLHVVGVTTGHPEFLWGTFEHNLNSPRVPDNQFSPSGSSSKGYTLYKAGTSYASVNIPNQSPPTTVTFDEKTQKFSPVTNAVLENETGGENHSPQGPANIANLNTSAHGFFASTNGLPPAERLFANYDLIGTVWMKPNTYVTSTANWQDLNQANAVGSVSLANTTAETFQQEATNAVPPKNLQNCFACHNPQVFAPGQKQLKARRIAISHVLGVGTGYAVPNVMPICQDVNAGPIWNNNDAKNKCPKVCGNSGNSIWNGQWKTTIPGQMSVCGCCGNTE
jgi:hypothetical protein